MKKNKIITMIFALSLAACTATAAWGQEAVPRTEIDPLDLTIEVMTDDMESAEDLVNTITLPLHLRDGIQERNGDLAGDSEVGQDKIDELQGPLDEMRDDIIEQQSETIQIMKEQQGEHGGHGSGR